MSGNARERRWLVLTQDGRHATLGRHSDPTPSELDAASDALRRDGVGGWLAVLDGAYYDPMAAGTLLMVRILAEPALDWPAAAEAFAERRRTSLQTGN